MLTPPVFNTRFKSRFAAAAQVLLILALSFGLAAPSQAQQDLARPVRLMTVEAESGGITRQFFGQVVARQTVDLAFQVGGQIVELPVIEGQQVAAGAMIAQLDLEPFELQLDQAQLQLEQAERTLARLNRLSGDTVSQVAVDDAETQQGLARIAVRNAEFSLDHATLTAPFTGLIAARNVANFTTVAAGTPIVRLHDMSDLRIEIDVPEILFQRAGEDADVTLFARFPVRDRLYPLEIREYDAEASAVGQTFRLTLGMDRPDGMNVLPGSSVTVFATIAEPGARLIIPATAVRIANDGTTQVMVFEPVGADTGAVTLRQVSLMPNRDGDFEVTQGLSEGDEIVTAGVYALQDGQNVRRFSGFAN